MTASAHDMLKQNDTDLIKPHQVEGFRHYLVSQKCKVRKGNDKGQFLFVETSAGWAALQRGAGGTVKSPIALRPVIQDYLKTPAARCVSLAKRISQAALVPVEAPDLAERVAEAVAQPEPAALEPVASMHLDWPWEGVNAPAAEPEAGQMSASGNSRDTGEGSQATSSFHVLPLGVQPPPPTATERSRQWAEFSDRLKTLDQLMRDNPGQQILLSPKLREMAAKGCLAIIEAPATVDLQHLEDLRDDFAIHCPLPQHEGEDLDTYADRRWAYADLMMSKRFPMDADK